jgi:hypothetical protein
MKIEILNDDMSGCNEYKIYDLYNHKHIENHKRNLFMRYFSEDDIYILLGESQFNKFTNGKYEFNVSKKQIFEASGNLRYYTP